MPNSTRRNALFYVTGATGAGVLGAGAWSLLQATRPTADVEAAGRGQIRAVGDMAPGTQIRACRSSSADAAPGSRPRVSRR